MTSEELINSVSKTVNEILNQSSDQIQQELFKDASESDNSEKVYAKMFINTINIATQISVQSTILLLRDLNIINPDDYKVLHEQPPLSLVWDSSKHQHEDNQ